MTSKARTATLHYRKWGLDGVTSATTRYQQWFHVSFHHCRQAGEFQIPSFRQAIT